MSCRIIDVAHRHGRTNRVTDLNCRRIDDIDRFRLPDRITALPDVGRGVTSAIAPMSNEILLKAMSEFLNLYIGVLLIKSSFRHFGMKRVLSAAM
ncbi:MAG: hypothetical protein H0U18_01855 [Pyrinomonadaceae bacterium]|nr:hypothetical protein [Pyrinomonadaceae bacterium]